MKKLFSSFMLLLVLFVQAKEAILFPKDFKLDARLLQGMVLTEINDEVKAMEIYDNPEVTKNKKTIQRLTKIESEDIQQVYYEIYQDKRDEYYVAGVIVIQFTSIETLQNNLKDLIAQSNLAYFIRDNYLIEVWSDASQNREQQILDMKSFYQTRVNANVHQAEERISEERAEDDEIVEPKTFE